MTQSMGHATAYERMADAPRLVAADTQPVSYDDVMVSDIITFGTCKTEWAITEKDGPWLHVRCIKHPDVMQLDSTHRLRNTTIYLVP